MLGRESAAGRFRSLTVFTTRPSSIWAECRGPSCTTTPNLFTDRYYSYPQILWRMLRFARNRPSLKTFLGVLVANLSYRSNQFLDRRIYANRPEPAERRSRPSA